MTSRFGGTDTGRGDASESRGTGQHAGPPRFPLSAASLRCRSFVLSTLSIEAGLDPLFAAMRSVFAPLVALAALAPLASASAIPFRRWNDANPGDITTDPLPPSKDPFYNVPKNVKSKQNGDILKSRPVWTQFDAYSRGVYQLLYKTTDAQGEATAAVTTVFTPPKPANPPRVMLLMSETSFHYPFAVSRIDPHVSAAPIDTACPDCEPAYALQTGSGSNASSFIIPEIAIDIVASLSKGWYVTVPDHDGLKAAFFAGVVEAFAGLDGLRALLNFPTVLPCPDNYKAVIHGWGLFRLSSRPFTHPI